ncbi:MAG: hypothetical protein B6U69_02035, partial [Thermofilum sp. ex4484_15]
MFKVLALCKFKEINKNNHERIVIGTFMGEGRSKLKGLNDLLGPSIILEVLDLMLDSPEELFNIREIA